MFYIVWFDAAKSHVVIPINWVYDYKKSVQKFMRKAINSNQLYRCYYSKEAILQNDAAAFLNPNFNALLADALPFNGPDACFMGRITHYFSKLFLKIICIVHT